MKGSNEELKAYQSIAQNLWVLKEEAAMTRPGEAQAIEDILQTLFNLNDGLKLPTVITHQTGEAVTAQDRGVDKILVHAH